MESTPSDQDGALTSSMLTYLAFTLGVVWLVKRLLSPSIHHNIPPFPVKPYPLLGHVPYFKRGMRTILHEWTSSTGPILSLKFGPRLVVIISGYDTHHLAYVKHADTLSDRPVSMSANTGGEDPNKGIVTASGHVWKEQRTVALHILRDFGMGKNLLATNINEEVSAYLGVISDFRGAARDVKLLTRTAVSNVICSIIVGKRFEYDDSYFVDFVDKMADLFRLTQSSSLYSIFPWLRHLPGDLFQAKKRIGLYRYIMDFFCFPYIEKTKQEDNGYSKDNFISAYLHEKKRKEKLGQDTTLDDENLSRSLFSLFVAGTDTTATNLTWFILYMLHNPDIQAKIHAEISDVVGTDRTPTLHDKNQLNLTVAAISETLRVSSPPLGLPHMCREDTVINGYTIPAGTTVLGHADSITRYSDIWKDPTQFNPYRFLDAKGNFSQPEQFTPFGIGRRACPAESMARMELYLFAATLIQRFELRPEEPGVLPTLKPIEGLTFTPQPFKLRFVERRHE